MAAKIAKFARLWVGRFRRYLEAHAEAFVDGASAALFGLWPLSLALALAAWLLPLPLDGDGRLEVALAADVALFLARDAAGAGLYAWRAVPFRYAASRILAAFAAEEIAAAAGDGGGWLGAVVFPLLAVGFRVWYILEPRALLRRRGARRLGFNDRLSYVLERYPFFLGYALPWLCARHFGGFAELACAVHLAAAPGWGEPSPKHPATFYVDPLDLLDEV